MILITLNNTPKSPERPIQANRRNSWEKCDRRGGERSEWRDGSTKEAMTDQTIRAQGVCVCVCVREAYNYWYILAQGIAQGVHTAAQGVHTSSGDSTGGTY